jgi:hypothetical protein
MIRVYFEQQRNKFCQLKAIFETEELYMACLPALEIQAGKGHFDLITESETGEDIAKLVELETFEEDFFEDLTKNVLDELEDLDSNQKSVFEFTHEEKADILISALQDYSLHSLRDAIQNEIEDKIKDIYDLG